MHLKRVFKLIFNKVFVQKLIAYFLLILIFFVFQDFLLLFFLVFIFAYLFLTFWKFLKEQFDDFLPKILRSQKIIVFFKKLFSLNIIIIFLYLAFTWLLFFALSDLLPQITKELRGVAEHVPFIADQVSIITGKLEEIKNLNTQLWGTLSEIISKQDMDLIVQVYERIKTAWLVMIQGLIALVLSYVFIIDREKIWTYLEWIKGSNFHFFYDEYKTIFEKIVKTFGMVFKAQSIIALANMILTTLWLMIIGYLHNIQFPFIYTLAIIVFVCGFIPVLGTFISSFPILLIGYSMVGWMAAVIEIIFLITFIHAIEAYYLNPKIVSSFVKIPVSLTFLILIIGEHFMGIAGLIIGISSFYLCVELFKDIDRLINKSRHTLSEMSDVHGETKEKIKNDVRMSRKM